MIARVLLPLPIDHPFDFAVLDNLRDEIAIGKRVVVRFHGREKTGIVQELAETSEHPGTLEPVLSVRLGPAFTVGSLKFCLDTATYYASPPGPFVNRLLPRTASTHRERYLRPVGKLDEIAVNIQSLSKRAPRQAEALRYLLATGTTCPESDLKRKLKMSTSVIKRLLDLGLIEEAPLEPELTETTLTKSSTIKDGTAKQTLIFSRSRMKEYIRAIEEAQARGESTLMLEPEILIGRAMFAKLQRSLAMPISLYHSGLPEGERGRVWNDVSRQAAHVVVGTRSALFLPFFKLGLVIVDEEQDRSYKQDEMIPHYHARDMVTRMTSVKAIFGSAAPSIETFFSAQEGNIQLVHDSATQTSINAMIVDIKEEKGTLSAPLLAAIAEVLAAKKRALIGVNARGHFQAVLCKKCGQPLRCPHCGANLTYDVRAAQLICRVCGVTQPRMACPNCGSRSLRFVGIGSERIGDELRERFPSASIANIDRSSLSSKAALAQAEGAIDGEAQIIVATPLAAKGPIIPGLGLAAAIGADAILARPDFRAAEQTYQYLTGLFGRLDGEGRAIVQTSYPDHYAVAAAARADYDLLYNREISEREAMFYPPFSHLARLLIPHVRKANRLIHMLGEYHVRVIGPAPHPRKRGQDLVLIKGQDVDIVRAACARVRAEIPGKSGSIVEIDIDPEHL